MMLMGAEKNV